MLWPATINHHVHCGTCSSSAGHGSGPHRPCCPITPLPTPPPPLPYLTPQAQAAHSRAQSNLRAEHMAALDAAECQLRALPQRHAALRGQAAAAYSAGLSAHEAAFAAVLAAHEAGLGALRLQYAGAEARHRDALQVLGAGGRGRGMGAGRSLCVYAPVCRHGYLCAHARPCQHGPCTQLVGMVTCCLQMLLKASRHPHLVPCPIPLPGSSWAYAALTLMSLCHPKGTVAPLGARALPPWCAYHPQRRLTPGPLVFFCCPGLPLQAVRGGHVAALGGLKDAYVGEAAALLEDYRARLAELRAAFVLLHEAELQEV